MRWPVTCLFLGAALAWGQPPAAEETASLVEMSRRVALDYGKSLPDFMCTQVVERFWQSLVRRSDWRAMDTLTIKLSYSGRREDHSLLLINGKPTDKHYDDIDGATTEGEFGGTLVQIFYPASKAVFTWEKWAHVHKRPAAVFSYRVIAANSRFALDSRTPGKVQELKVGFHGVVEVDRETGETLHFTYIADGIPKDFPIVGSETSVDYDKANIGGKDYLLPAFCETVMRSGSTALRNKVEFREYRKFAADSSVTFDPGKKP
jgi:hypothetical protein